MDHKRQHQLMNYVNNWGACVVLAGALFKLMHWPGASLMLIVGMGTEILIFFMQGLGKPMELPKWERLFPQVHPDWDPEVEGEAEAVDISSMIGGGGGSQTSSLEAAQGLAAADASEVSKGLGVLSDAAKNLTKIGDAGIAATQLTENLNSVVNVFEELHVRGQRTVENFDEFDTAVHGVMKHINSGNEKLVNAIDAFSDKIGNYTLISDGEKISKTLQRLNGHMNSLCSVYELQLESSKAHDAALNQLGVGMKKLNLELTRSADAVGEYHKKAQDLGEKLDGLNSVYGNMLSAF